MQPQPPQPSPTAYLEQYPAPGSVRSLAVVLWVSAAVSLAVLVINMATAPMAGVEPGYAFGYSLPHVVVGALLAVTAYPVTRGRSWARRMAKVVLIIQIVMQSLLLVGGTSPFWALLLLPLAIAGVVLLHQPMSKWFFTAHQEAVYQEYLQRYAAYYTQHHVDQGHYPPHQYPQQAYEQQPPHGSWEQDPRQQ